MTGRTEATLPAAKETKRATPRTTLAARRRRERIEILGTQAGVVVVGLVLWEMLARFKVIDPFFLSQPSSVAGAAFRAVTEGTLWFDTFYTLQSTLIGFFIGTSVGALLGLSLWWWDRAARVAEPFIIAFNAVPKLALAPLLLLFFGIGLMSKVAMAVALTIVVSILTAFGGVRSVDRDLQLLLYSLGAKRYQVFTKVVIPSAMPWIISALRINIGLSLTGAFVGEMVASQHGLGRMIVYASTVYDVALVWVGTIVLSVLAILMYVATTQLERWLLKGLHGAVPG